MRKKGFSLVELSVVVLIIGIIAALVIKGQALMDTAHIRKEVYKLEKVRTAIYALVTAKHAKTDSIKREADNITLEMRQFYDGYYLTEGDLRVTDTTPWVLTFCSYDDNGTMYLHNSEAFKSICAVNEHLFYDLGCYTEVLMDDQNVRTGYGLSTGAKYTSDADNFTVGKFDCDNVTRLQGDADINALPEYGFMIFS